MKAERDRWQNAAIVNERGEIAEREACGKALADRDQYKQKAEEAETNLKKLLVRELAWKQKAERLKKELEKSALALSLYQSEMPCVHDWYLGSCAHCGKTVSQVRELAARAGKGGAK